MIESGMYFVLGLATAGLLALMIAPIPWRRAVRLTRARIEHAVPANLTEIQADKDQLRAEFAMSARRLETTIESLRQKAGQQMVDINQKRELIRRLAEEQTLRIEALEQLEERESELHKVLNRREDRMAEANSEMKTLRNNLAERGRALEQLEQTLKTASSSNEEATVELVARGTEVENLRDNLAAANSRQTALRIERTRLESELAEAQSAKAVIAQKVEALEQRLAGVESEHQTHVAEVDARDREIDRLRKQAIDHAHAFSEVEGRLVEAEAANADVTARISQLTLELDKMSRREPSEELRGALIQLETERDALSVELASAREALARMEAENAELQRISGDDWEAERIQNAMLRERLNDIAGEVAQLTRSYQEDIGLSELSALSREEGAADGRTGDGPADRSLAQRIRTLQRSPQRT